MDCIVFKVRDNGKIINKTVSLCVGLKQTAWRKFLACGSANRRPDRFKSPWSTGYTDYLYQQSEWIYGYHPYHISSVIPQRNLCGTSEQKLLYQTVFFQFPLEIRKIIYTTNLIENLNGKIRKYTKSKLSFPSDEAVKKTVFLSIMEIEKKWTQPIHNWGLIMNQFILIFENRIQI